MVVFAMMSRWNSRHRNERIHCHLWCKPGIAWSGVSLAEPWLVVSKAFEDDMLLEAKVSRKFVLKQSLGEIHDIVGALMFTVLLEPSDDPVTESDFHDWRD